MSKIRFRENGIIGKSGKWYGCSFHRHIRTMRRYYEDAPFVVCHNGGYVFFEAYFTANKTKPTKAQFETLMNWCTAMKVRFEDVIIRDEPWQDFIG